MRFNALVVVAAAFTGMLVMGCAPSLEVRHVNDRSLDTARYRSFHLLADPSDGPRLAKLDARLKSALTDRGLVAAKDAASADVIVIRHLDLARTDGSDPKEASKLTTDPATGLAVETKKNLVILMQDAKTRKVLWVAWAQAQVDDAKLDTTVTEAMQRIVAKLPRRS